MTDKITINCEADAEAVRAALVDYDKAKDAVENFGGHCNVRVSASKEYCLIRETYKGVLYAHCEHRWSYGNVKRLRDALTMALSKMEG